MENNALASATYITGIGLFITVGVAVMFGLPHLVFAQGWGQLRRYAIPTIVIMLLLTLIGALAVWIGQAG